MNRLLKRVAMLALCGLMLLWSSWAGAAQTNLDTPALGSTLPSYLQTGGAVYQGPGVQRFTSGQQAAASGALSASTYWWYFTSGHYNVLMPGTSAGPYSSYYYAASSMSPYLGNSYDAASGVLGWGVNSNIDLWLTYDGGNSAVGWYYPGTRANDIYLNMAYPGSGAYWGSVAAHETTHLILDVAANFYNRDPWGSQWYTEALAYYVGNTVYAYGNGYGYSYNSSWLWQASRDGAWRADWYSSGVRYNILNTDTNLDYVQLNTIGYFLAHSNLGVSAIRGTVNNLVGGQGLESALQNTYGMASGMHDTDSGPGVNTLYSNYLNYYLGHY